MMATEPSAPVIPLDEALDRKAAKIRAELAEVEASRSQLKSLAAGTSAALEATPPPDEKPSPIRLADFLRLPARSQNWVVPGLIPAAGVGVLASEAYMGKSTLLAQMAVCIAAGLPWLGFPIPTPGISLYWQAEGQPELFAQRIACASHHLGLSAEQLEALDVFLPPSDFLAPFNASAFADFIAESKAVFVVCDTAFFFTDDADENLSKDWKKFVIKPLKSVARATRCAFALTHHYGKPSEQRTGKNRTRGTSAIQGDCDFLFRLEGPGPRSDERTLYFDKVKDSPLPEDFAVSFDKTTATFKRETEAEAETVARAALDKEIRLAVQRTSAALSRSPLGLSGKQLRELASLNGGQWKLAREWMEQNHKIRHETRQGQGGGVLWFALDAGIVPDPKVGT